MPVRTAVWFRHDLRIHDNPALFEACQSGREVIGLVIITPEQWRQHSLSARRLKLMLSALHALRSNLAELGIRLQIHRCPTF